MELKADNQPNEIELPFIRYYFRHSKALLLFTGLATLYCLGYGVLLFQEFSRMGIINMIMHSK